MAAIKSGREGQPRYTTCSISELRLVEREASEAGRLIQKLSPPEQCPHYGLLIRPNTDELVLFEDVENVMTTPLAPSGPIDVANLVRNVRFRNELQKLSLKPMPQTQLLLLGNIESVAFTKLGRLILLDFLEEIVYVAKRVSVVMFCDVSPLYMLTRQSEYLSDDSTSEFADAQEIVRWSRLLSQFSKYYGWSPRVYSFVDNTPVNNILLREITIWPKLYALADVFRALDIDSESGLSEEQIVQFVGAHAAAEYRRRWSMCTRAERLILYQLVNGLAINARNIEPLEHLMRRGYVVRNPRWSIANKSFARFVRTAETEAIYQDWMEVSQRGLWQLVKVPLIGLAFAGIGLIIYSTQERIDSVVTLATGILTLIPLLLKSFSLVKGGGDGQVGN